MDKAILDGYTEKLNAMVQCAITADEVMHTDIKPRNQDNPMYSMMWLEGAKNGLLIFLFRILTEQEGQLNREVLAHAKQAVGGGDNPLSLDEYLNSAVAVLAGYGYEIPLDE